VVVQPTNPPPPPPPPTDVPPPPQPSFPYLYVPASCNTDDPAACNVQGGVHCEHSGQHSIKVIVYDDRNDPNSVLAGIKVRFSGAPGGAMIEPDEVTTYDGSAVKTLSNVLDHPSKNIGNYFAWLVDGDGNQISEFSPVIPINDLQPENPQVCWVAHVIFAG
jgi:hypothetical protein